VAGCAATFPVIVFCAKWGKKRSRNLRSIFENKMDLSLKWVCGWLFASMTLLFFVLPYLHTTLTAFSTTETVLLMTPIAFFMGGPCLECWRKSLEMIVCHGE
jgi:hypothetical protein